MFEREYRELSFVPRWPIIRRIKEQSVAEHSYYVTLYAGQVAELIEYKGDRAMLLDMALRHDIEESFTSDIPGPSKRAMIDDEKANRWVIDELNRRFLENFRQIPMEEELNIKLIIKIADLLDEVFYLATEQQLGNRAISKVLEHSYDRLFKAWHALCTHLDVTPQVRLRGSDDIESSFKRHISDQSIMVTG